MRVGCRSRRWGWWHGVVAPPTPKAKQATWLVVRQPEDKMTMKCMTIPAPLSGEKRREKNTDVGVHGRILTGFEGASSASRILQWYAAGKRRGGGWPSCNLPSLGSGRELAQTLPPARRGWWVWSACSAPCTALLYWIAQYKLPTRYVRSSRRPYFSHPLVSFVLSVYGVVLGLPAPVRLCYLGICRLVYLVRGKRQDVTVPQPTNMTGRCNGSTSS